MKKSVLALAILGAFSSAAFAQTSSVQIYGIVDTAFVHDSGNGVSGSVNKVDSSNTSGNKAGSRIGFKGKEDLGSGLSALFTIENGFKADDGSADQGGTLFGRQAFVGLQGGFGTVKLGRQYNPLYSVQVATDPFSNGMAGAFSRLISTGGAASATSFGIGAGSRADNAITYTTPELSGFKGELQYGFGEVAGDSSRSRQYGLSVTYANGPISAGLAHQNVNNNPAAGVAINTIKNTALTGTYNFGVAKAHALYQANKDDGTGATALDTRDWMLGVSVPFGASTVVASYIKHDNRAVANADAKQFAVGYIYALSKRTSLYTSYGRLSNDNASLVRVTKAGENNSVFSAGVNHTF